MFCNNCGKNLKDGARFCGFCGTAVINDEAAREVEETPKFYKQEEPVEKKKKKLWIIPIVVAVIILLAAVIAVFIIKSSEPEADTYESLMADAQRYLSELNYDEAKVAYLNAIEIEPTHVEPYLELADVYFTCEENDDAVDILEQAIDVIPAEPQPYVVLIVYYKEEGEYESAKELAELAYSNVEDDDKNKFIEYIEELENELEAIIAKEYENVFLAKLSELTDEYGIFEAEQSGTMYSYTDKWLDPSGVMDAQIMDFDSDGDMEMLVFISTPYTYYTGYYAVTMYMYELADGVAELADSMLCGEYDAGSYGSWSCIMLRENECFVDYYSMQLLLIEDKYYMFFNSQYLVNSFADGSEESYWMIEYTGEALNYVCYYYRLYDGGGDFIYGGYTIIDGVCTGHDIYYSVYDEWSDEKEGLYSTYGEGIKNYFDNYGVSLSAATISADYYHDGYGSILSNDNNIISAFEFYNNQLSEDWSNSKFTYKATLIRSNDLIG